MFLDLGIQNAMCMNILSLVACQALQYFSTLSHKRHDFRENVIENKLCVLIFYKILFETFLILRRNERDVIKNVQWLSCKVAAIFVRF
jgi:hypothetical protein